MKETTCPMCSGRGTVPNQKQLARALRKLRSDAGMTQGAAARRLGISQPYLCDLERGRRPWSPQMEKRYRKIVGAR